MIAFPFRHWFETKIWLGHTHRQGIMQGELAREVFVGKSAVAILSTLIDHYLRTRVSARGRKA